MTYYTFEETPEGYLFRRVVEAGTPPATGDPTPKPTPAPVPAGVRVVEGAIDLDFDSSSMAFTLNKTPPLSHAR